MKNGRARSCGCLKLEILKRGAWYKKGTGKNDKVRRSDAIKNAKQWAKNNPEKRKLICKKSYEKNKSKNQKYREKNRLNKKLYDLKYREENKEKIAANRRLQDHNRRIREVKQKGVVSKNIIEKLMALQKGKCAICKCCLKNNGSHLDHVMPLAKGGMHDDDNFQLLCPFCNISKGAKDPIQYMQSKGFLL